MSHRTIFRRVAREDVRAARRWYEERRPGLGAAFLQSLEICIAQIERTPEIWPCVDGETRRGRLRRFPHVVYKRILSPDAKWMRDYLAFGSALRISGIRS